jgi:cation transport ATPase
MSAAITGTASAPESREVELSIRGMTCAACAARVEKKLSALDDVSAAVNFATETATVSALASVPVARLIEAIEQAGYGADLARPRAGADGPADAGGARADAARVAYLRRRLIVALVFFVPLTDLSVLLSLFGWARFPGWQWVLVAMAAPVAGWAAWPFHQAALKNARHGAASMDTVTGVQPAAGTSRAVLLRRLGGVEDASGHPVAAAVSAAARAELGNLPRAGGFESLPGLGARGVVDGQEVIAGRDTLFRDRGIAIPADLGGQCAAWEREGHTVVLAGWGGQAAARSRSRTRSRPPPPRRSAGCAGWACARCC